MKTSRRDSYDFSSSPVWTWELDCKEAWAPKNCCFHTVVLEKTLEVLLDSMEIKPLSPEEINSEYSLEGLMLKLKLRYFGHLMWKAYSLEKTLMLGKIQGGRKRSRQRMRWLDDITDSMNMSAISGDSKGQKSPACCSPWGYKESDMT